MLVTFVVSPLGIAFAILLVYFLVLEQNQLADLKVAIGFTITFVLGFGSYAAYILKEGVVRVVVSGENWKERANEIARMRERLGKKKFLQMGLSILYIVLWIITLTNKIEFPTIFFQTYFMLFLPFSLAYATIIVCDRMNISKLITCLAVLSMVFYLATWGISKGTHRLNSQVNVCADDSLLLLVSFFILLNWNHLATCIMFIIVCGITLYFAGFNRSYCKQISPLISQQLMLKITAFTLIATNLLRIIIIFFVNPNFFQLPSLQQIAPLHQSPSQTNLNLEPQIQKRLSYLESTKHFPSSSLQSCPICLFEFSPSKQIVNLPCNHTFDYECIVEWMNKYPHCPNCRKILQPI